jgi:hypothetical protein
MAHQKHKTLSGLGWLPAQTPEADLNSRHLDANIQYAETRVARKRSDVEYALNWF